MMIPMMNHQVNGDRGRLNEQSSSEFNEHGILPIGQCRYVQNLLIKTRVNENEMLVYRLLQLNEALSASNNCFT